MVCQDDRKIDLEVTCASFRDVFARQTVPGLYVRKEARTLWFERDDGGRSTQGPTPKKKTIKKQQKIHTKNRIGRMCTDCVEK